MAAGINLSLVSDVRDFLKGTASVEDALDDVAGSLDDLAREGQRSSDKIEQEFGGSFSDVMRQSDELRRELEGDLERTAREGDTAAEKLELTALRAKARRLETEQARDKWYRGFRATVARWMNAAKSDGYPPDWQPPPDELPSVPLPDRGGMGVIEYLEHLKGPGGKELACVAVPD